MFKHPCSQQHYSQQPKGRSNTMSIYGWVYKQNVVYAYNGTLLCLIKRKGTLIHANMNESWGHCAKWNKHVTKGLVSLHLYEVPRVIKFIETGRRTMVNRKWEEGVWYRPLLFNGMNWMEFQFIQWNELYGISLWDN